MVEEADDSWTVNSSDAFTVSLVAGSLTPAEPRTLSTFNPKFTYPIFGEDERIFGYQNLKINLRLHARDMRPNVKVSYSKKFRAVGDTEATDVDGILRDFLPKIAFAKDQDYSAALSQASENWTPPGEKIAAFEAKDGSYEVWQASFVHEEIRQFIKRFQILVLMFIEGGSYILNGTNDDDPTLDRWTAFFLYQKRPALSDPSQQEYHFAGFSTVYRFFPVETLTPPASPSNGEQSHQSSLDDFNFKSGDFSLFSLPCRTRISQFVILPPFQGRGLGGNLYSAIYQNYLQHAETLELTVEDPNEAFDDMRDLADLTFLRTTPEFGSLKLDKSVVLPRKGAAPRNIVDLAESEKVRRKYKIAPRQFYRVLEMDLMSKLPDAVRPGITTDANGKMAVPRGDAHLYKLWQLLVKQRLYRHNKDALIQLEHTERLEKLTETLASVEFEYMRLLALLEQRSATTPSATANGKRKVDGNGGSEESLAKRVRMANE